MNFFERKLIVGERVMYADGTRPVNCVFTVSLQGELSEERLRFALNKVQAKHPLLQARIQTKRGRPYFLGDGLAPKIPVRVLQRKSDEDWQKVTEEEWELPFDVKEGPLARVVWLRSEEVSELLLICPHCICDGATGVTLMREFLLLLDRPEASIGHSPVFQSMKDIVPRSFYAGKLKGYLKSLLMRALFFLRPIRHAGVEGKKYAIRWRLEENRSEGFVERCKMERVTVHSALCVALLEAYRDVKKDAAKNKVICPVDIRRFVREIRKDMMFAFAPIVELRLVGPGAGVGVGGAERTDFWELCRQLKGDLAEKMETIKAYELLLHSEYYHPVTKKLIRWLCAEEGSHDFTFSNMGRLDIGGGYSTFLVRAAYSPTVAFPWRNPTTVVVSSFGGTMDFAYVSNTGYVRYDEAMAIRLRVMEIVETVLSTVAVPIDSR